LTEIGVVQWDVPVTTPSYRSQLIRELQQSGQTPVAFARARGIRPDTLKWWQWRLARETKTPLARPRPSRVKLIAVQPAKETTADGRNTATPVWELVAPSGHELRVYDPHGLEVLKAALFLLGGSRRR
jgi:transposase-like protein